MNSWYTIRAQSTGAEVVIYDEIGAYGVSAKGFLAELGALPDGSVFRFRLPYFSTSSMKAVYLVVQKIREGMKAAGRTFTIQWVVEDDDDFMSEAAENFSTLLDIPILVVHQNEEEGEAELARLSKQCELS